MIDSSERIERLIGCLVQVIGRSVLPADAVRDLVGPGRLLKAYNLCDGTRTQTEIRKKLGLDSGNFSRTTTRWIENGIAFELGAGKESRILHIYPLPLVANKGKTKK